MMTVKNQFFLILLCMINFFIIQPSLVLCDDVDIQIFGIKVKTIQVDNLTKGKKIAYIVLNYVISGLCAIALVLVIVFLCCMVVCCSNKKKSGRRTIDEEVGTDSFSDEEERKPGNEKNEMNDETER
ncbi:hypothetical protein C1645_762446 [Glomus cerebriforme]|uniref:Uncharacterized protein n=1 Tax=Glomus cerebriforme TaxID=658196 RepID=A0A397T552_9GLOM|nr:hypothetical protein C1645_762446 [Glomus cerebriforme]